jgi:integrase
VSLKLVPPNLKRRCPFYTVRGTHLGIRLDRSTKTASRAVASKLLQAWRSDIERQTISRPGEPTFLDAAVSYMAAHGDRRFLPPILEEIGTTALSKIDQTTIDDLAIRLYPTASAATRNRQVYTPVSAVLKNAKVKWELERPKGWRGQQRTDWLKPPEAFAALEAAEKIDAEFGIFLTLLCYTGLRLSEALELTPRQIELSESFAYVPRTKNEAPRGVFLPPAAVAALARHPRGLDREADRAFSASARTAASTPSWGRPRRRPGPIQASSPSTSSGTPGRRGCAATAALDLHGLVATEAWKDPASAARYAHVVASEESRKSELLTSGEDVDFAGGQTANS